MKYPLRIPRLAFGIRSQSVRNGREGEWWAARWREALEMMRLGPRLGRARNYAMSGQVIQMSFETTADETHRCKVNATVVGARTEPYQVEMLFRSPAGEDRARIVEELRAEPILVARLMADELPLEVLEIFRRYGYDLFPGGKLAERVYDMTCSCSCPDYANPCKHTAAALMILGEEVARRPMALLELRGIREEDLL